MPEDKNEALSPEEIKVNAVFEKYDADIAEVEAQLNAINDPQPRQKHVPSFLRNDFTPKDETKAHLQNKIPILEKQAKGRAAEIAEKSQPAVQGKIYEKANTWRKEPKDQKDEKTVDESTNFVGMLRERGKLATQQKEFDATKEQAGTPFAENRQDATVQPSNYYSHLHFNDIDNPKIPDADKEMDAPEPDKED